MNILVTGASGFIASQIVTDLLAAGHQVTCAVRNIKYTQNLFPTTKVIRCDFIHDTNPAVWLPRLKDIDIVINCVGILYHPRKRIIWAVHFDTPRALFDASVTAGVKKIIQISALGIDKSPVDYATSKKAADDYLFKLPIQSIILRPSLVYGRGSYGGSSLFRGLAGLPFIIPIPGKGMQSFQPIYLGDLSQAIVKMIVMPKKPSMILAAVSSQQITLREILQKIRAWLGFSQAIFVFMPLLFIRMGAFFGDFIPYSSLNSSSYKMLMQNNIASDNAASDFAREIGFTPRSFVEGVYTQPSSVQDHWHARLFFLKPLLQYSIAFIWIWTALCSLFFYPRTESYELLAQIGVNAGWQPILLYSASGLDALLGICMLLGVQLRKVCVLQLFVILIYSFIITIKLPFLWLEPFGPVAKNIPLFVAILVFLALESDR